MDFIQEIVSVDKSNKTITFRLIPDPRRYEWKKVEGKRYLYDKLDDSLFSEEVYLNLVNQMNGQNIYFQPQKINDVEQYVKERLKSIRERLRGIEKPAVLIDKSEAFLDSLAVNKLQFVILSVDIVKSTKMAAELDQERYARLISTTLYEMSEIIPKFNGHVLKYTGDGLIAYFPAPSFITKNDLAIDCALTLRQLVYEGLNQIFKDEGYPSIDIRIGIDSGEAYVVRIGSPETKQHKDIIGSVVSLAAKIQSLGKPGEILLGETTLRNLHTMWREKCEIVILDESWTYKIGEDIYKIYKVKINVN